MNDSLSPDLATCADCLAELRDSSDRRYRYPFVSCGACGPRYAVRFSADNSAMAGFVRCGACQAEYDDPAGRRYRSPSTCCPACGPGLRLVTPTQPTRYDEEAVTEARAVLREGGVLAVKTTGGYRLACDATNGYTVAMLRKRLQRGDEPFATMVAGLDEAQHLIGIGPAEEALLSDRARPVVQASRRVGALAAAVAPGQGDLGVMLAAEPVHHLLLGLPGDGSGPAALVLTGARHAGGPLVTDDAEALAQLDGVADAWLVHDAPVAVPVDDSQVLAVAGTSTPVRTARGYAPVRLALPFEAPPTLAVGGDATGSFCIAEGRVAWLSGHLGHLTSPAAASALALAVDRLSTLTAISPEVVVTDRDPLSVCRRWTHDRFPATRAVEVQHHHAHVAATMAEHQLTGDQSVIGVVLDAAAAGDDGGTWGGEFLVADYREYDRAAHLGYVDLPRGDSSPHPYRAALAYLRSAGVPWDPSLPSVRAGDDTDLGLLDEQLDDGRQCVPTSSMATLHDAVASLTGICHRTEYDGQAAYELEARARAFELGDLGRRTRVYEFGDDADPTPIIWSVVQDVRKGVDPGLVAARFQQSVVDLVVGTVRRLHERTHLATVTLSGGLFAHPFLATACAHRLRADGFQVLVHQRVPAGEGGLALGQLAVLAHQG